MAHQFHRAAQKEECQGSMLMLWASWQLREKNPNSSPVNPAQKWSPQLKETGDHACSLSKAVRYRCKVQGKGLGLSLLQVAYQRKGAVGSPIREGD
jgi:hypothetical protein